VEIVADLDVAAIREDFPILRQTPRGVRMVYLDSGASALPAHAVVQAMSTYQETTHANVHRGVYATAEQATHLYEQARVDVGTFLSAPHPVDEIVFTKNCTEAFNVMAQSWGAANLGEGDVVVLSEMEHHANIVPWQQLQARNGFTIKFLGITEERTLDLSNLDELLDGAKLLSITATSNVLGTMNPIKELSRRAHAAGALIAVDGAQAVPHEKVDVADLDIDFLAFSPHKIYGPTGIGVLYAKRQHLADMPPFLGGGGMIKDVRLDGFLAADGPQRFEAGTPPITEAVGLSAALRYVSHLGLESISAHHRRLTSYALAALETQFSGQVVVQGPVDSPQRAGVLSLTIDGIHAHDIAQVLDTYGVCVRPGHHCAKPLMRRLGVNATARASFGVYNDVDDIDTLIEALHATIKMFA
jgi:cysteine desulfurase/selenocysteine lyase